MLHNAKGVQTVSVVAFILFVLVVAVCGFLDLPMWAMAAGLLATALLALWGAVSLLRLPDEEAAQIGTWTNAGLWAETFLMTGLAGLMLYRTFVH